MGREGNGVSLEGVEQMLERQNAKFWRAVVTLGGSSRRGFTHEESDSRSRRGTGKRGVDAEGRMAGGAPTTATMGVCVTSGSPDTQERFAGAETNAPHRNGSDRNCGVRLPVVLAPNIRARRTGW